MASSRGSDGPTGSFDDFQNLVQIVYAAALDQSRWDDVLSALSRSAGDICTHIVGHNKRSNFHFSFKGSTYPDEYMSTYTDYYAQLNPWIAGMETSDVGVPIAGEEFCPRDALLRTEFYSDWIYPQEDLSAGGGIILFNDDERFLMLGGNIRYKDQERLEGRWLALLGLLRPHLRNAFEIARTLEGVSLQAVALDQAHRDLRAAIFIVESSGQVTFSNTTGERMLEDGEVLQEDCLGRLRATDPVANDALRKSLRSLKDGSSALASAIHMEDAEGRLTHVCRASRFSPDELPFSPFGSAFSFHEPCLLLTIASVPADRQIESQLKQTYGLTLSEAEVTLAVADGATLQEVAERRDVSIHTVRNQMKAIQMKTSTHRQSDLVRLVERLRLLGTL